MSENSLKRKMPTDGYEDRGIVSGGGGGSAQMPRLDHRSMSKWEFVCGNRSNKDFYVTDSKFAKDFLPEGIGKDASFQIVSSSVVGKLKKAKTEVAVLQELVACGPDSEALKAAMKVKDSKAVDEILKGYVFPDVFLVTANHEMADREEAAGDVKRIIDKHFRESKSEVVAWDRGDELQSTLKAASNVLTYAGWGTTEGSFFMFMFVGGSTIHMGIGIMVNRKIIKDGKEVSVLKPEATNSKWFSSKKDFGQITDYIKTLIKFFSKGPYRMLIAGSPTYLSSDTEDLKFFKKDKDKKVINDIEKFDEYKLQKLVKLAGKPQDEGGLDRGDKVNIGQEILRAVANATGVKSFGTTGPFSKRTVARVPMRRNASERMKRAAAVRFAMAVDNQDLTPLEKHILMQAYDRVMPKVYSREVDSYGAINKMSEVMKQLTSEAYRKKLIKKGMPEEDADYKKNMWLTKPYTSEERDRFNKVLLEALKTALKQVEMVEGHPKMLRVYKFEN